MYSDDDLELALALSLSEQTESKGPSLEPEKTEIQRAESEEQPIQIGRNSDEFGSVGQSLNQSARRRSSNSPRKKRRKYDDDGMMELAIALSLSLAEDPSSSSSFKISQFEEAGGMSQSSSGISSYLSECQIRVSNTHQYDNHSVNH